MVFHGALGGVAGIDEGPCVGDLNEVVDPETFRHAWGVVVTTTSGTSRNEAIAMQREGRMGARLEE
jgi:hypothetical protein